MRMAIHRSHHSLGPLASVALAVLLAACGLVGPDYFRPNGISVTAPLEVGRTLYIGSAFLTAHPGDEVRLESVDVVGVDDAWVEAYVLPEGRGAIGAVYEDSIVGGRPAVEQVEPLEGFTFTTDDGHVGVIVALTVPVETVVEMEETSLRFTVNGFSDVETFSTQATICVATPAPPACRGTSDEDS